MELGEISGGQIAVPSVETLEPVPRIVEEEPVTHGIDRAEKQEDLGRRDHIAALKMRQHRFTERLAVSLPGMPSSGDEGRTHDRIRTFFRTGLSSPRNPSTTVAPLGLTFDPRTRSRLSASA